MIRHLPDFITANRDPVRRVVDEGPTLYYRARAFRDGMPPKRKLRATIRGTCCWIRNVEPAKRSGFPSPEEGRVWSTTLGKGSSGVYWQPTLFDVQISVA